jgi:hypothetical protein
MYCGRSRFGKGGSGIDSGKRLRDSEEIFLLVVVLSTALDWIDSGLHAPSLHTTLATTGFVWWWKKCGRFDEDGWID